MMSNLLFPTIEEQIAEVERELAMRRRVYPRMIEIKKTTKPKADRQIAVLEAVLDTLRAIKTAQPATQAAPPQ